MGRILAIDYGTKRTGIAVTDPLRIVPGGLRTVATHELNAFLADYFSKESVKRIIIIEVSDEMQALIKRYAALGAFQVN